MLQAAIRVICVLLTAVGFAFSVPSFGQSYPNKPIKLIVPYPPGGGIDPTARILAKGLTEQLGQEVVVENMSGASGRIGTRHAADAAPDGYTLLFGSVAPNAILPAAYGNKLSYDTEKDFAPISLVAQADYVLIVNKALPVHSVKELIEYAKAHPNKLSFASSGILGGPHLAGEELNTLAHINILHVPYRGDGPAMTALLGGQVSMMFDSAGGVASHLKSGGFRVLAYSGNVPFTAVPNVPNIAQILPGHSVMQWYGLLAVAGTPANVIKRLYEATHQVMQDPDVKRKYEGLGIAAVSDSSPDRFRSYIHNDIQKWRKIIKGANITLPPL